MSKPVMTKSTKPHLEFSFLFVFFILKLSKGNLHIPFKKVIESKIQELIVALIGELYVYYTYTKFQEGISISI